MAMKPRAAPAHWPYAHRSLADAPILPASTEGQRIFVAFIPRRFIIEVGR